MEKPDHPKIAQLENTIQEMEEHRRAVKMLRERLRIEVSGLDEVEPGSERLALVRYGQKHRPPF